MDNLKRICLFAIALFALSGLAAYAQSGAVHKDLPPGVAALAPEGAKIQSRDATHSAMNDMMGFYAKKTFPNSNDEVTYSVSITCFEPKMWPIFKPSYQTMVTQSIESLRKSMTAQSPAGNPPKVINHSWGGGVVQRTETKQFNVIDGPDTKTNTTVISCDCHYYGIAGSSIFECRVQCSGSPGNVGNAATEADHWAEKVADQAAKTSYGILAQ